MTSELGRFQAWDAEQFGLSFIVEDAIYDDEPVKCDGKCGEMFIGSGIVVSIYPLGDPDAIDLISVLAYCPKCSKEWNDLRRDE